MKLMVLILIAIIVPGGSVALLAYLRHRRYAAQAAALDIALAVNREGLEAKLSGQVLDESLQARARHRREIADQVRRRSAQIASGASSASVLRMARKA